MEADEHHQEESSPLLPTQHQSPPATDNDFKFASPDKPSSSPAPGQFPAWTANGLPLNHGSVLGEPVARAQWDSGLFSCIGRNDHFCSSDLEVCLLGSIAPCVLYGSNAERLGAGSTPGTFANHCLPYTGLYFLGNSLFGWNCFAPWFSYRGRSIMRRMFNLEGSCEALNRSFGCCGSCVKDELQREDCESASDLATHVFCHICALCQEGRELRRRVPHPGFNARPVLMMLPPGEQTMGRGGV
uniref:PLAC8 family protein n=1 Tax=Kalanchoe fedtschenkoi TaxID=63787 RepID=A0A7N0UTW1_KALFE